MFCPRCGQEQISEETRFCSRCGFLMAGVNELLVNGGNLPYLAAASDAKGITPRKRGVRQGLFIFLLSFLIVPLIVILTIAANAEPYAVVISAIILTVGGLLRMVYALMFESNFPNEKMLEQNIYQPAPNLFNKKQDYNALPPQKSIPADAYIPPTQGNWRDTNDLTPNSVIEGTTKLLEKDEIEK